MVFISYATENLAYATELFKQLHFKHYKVWFAPVAIRYGANFAEEIGNALLDSADTQFTAALRDVSEDDLVDARLKNCASCKALIFICSRFSKSSVWCRREVKAAITRGIPIFVLRVDNSADPAEWGLMLIDIQTMNAQRLTREVVDKIVEFLPRDLCTASDGAAVSTTEAISYRDIQIEAVASGDPYFEEGSSLFCNLSKQCFYLAPPADMVTQEMQEWREAHFAKSDVIFDSTLALIAAQTEIPDLTERIEKSRRTVFSDFIHRKNGCYFNNKKYGINRINPYGRTEDFSEIPVLDLELYTTDYYTHRVMKDVCKKLYQEHHMLFHQSFHPDVVEKHKILLTSLGINLLLLDADKRLQQKTLLTVRSTTCAESVEEKISLSVIEGVSLSDYDHYQRKVNLSDAVKRGLEEELGVKAEMLDASAFRFYDLFVNLQNLEFGISCSATLKDSMSLEDVAQLNGKDKRLEVRSCRIIKVSDLRSFVLARQNAFLPQAICAIGSYVNRYENRALLCDEVKKYKEECFLFGKTGNPERCEDMIVKGEHFYAVIDGVTSKSALTYDGKAGGRYAAKLLAAAIGQLDARATAVSAFEELDRTIARAYHVESGAPEDRIQACAIIYSKYRREIWNYGDCNLMINERRITHKKIIDDVLSMLRSFVISAYLKQGGDEGRLREKDVGREAILPFLKKQSLFANSEGFFGYPVVDGTGIKKNYLKVYRVVKGDHVVLASDGYPKLFSSLEESEGHLQEILAADPLAIRENMQTKMIASDNLSFDDRAYLSFFVT